MKHLARKDTWIRLVSFSLFLLLLLTIVGASPVLAQDGGGGAGEAGGAGSGGAEGETIIQFFWGNGCPHCAAAEPWFDDLDERYEEVRVVKYEVWYNDANNQLYQETADRLNVPQGGRGVPFIVINDQYWMGFDEGVGQQIEEYVKSRGAAPVDPRNLIEVPLFGTVNLAGKSAFLSTALIAFVDGFNPCSIWVLTMLLALTLHTGSRRKVMIIGLIFLTVTAAIYGLFITGLFAALNIAQFTGWIQVVVALVALFFAIVNIKDYFWYKEGVSFTISDDSKPGIFQRVRRVMDASNNFWSMAGATVVLAAGVSLVEFSCTVGLPMVWTNILTSQGITAGAFAVLLLIYLLIYQLDELLIFATAVYTMKATRMEEKQGRILKLISGVLMLVLAVVMLVNPLLLENIGTSLVVFAVAFALVLLVLVLHRRVLPAYGIWIGTEDTGKGKSAKRKIRRASH